MTTSRRALVALATGALTLPFLAVPAAHAVAPEPPAQQPISTFCDAVPDDYDPFTDDDGNFFVDAIECVAYAKVTTGLSGGRQYGPGLSVQRDQMASFIARLIDTANTLDTGENVRALPTYDGSNAFTDVAAGNVHLQAINRLEAVDIVQGGPGGRPPSQYGPELPVTRAQMASFINRAIAFMQGGDPAQAGVTTGYVSSNDYFTDDENATAHERNINGIASEGIAVGDGADTYNPELAIRRDQMAGFLARTLASLQEAGDITPLGGEPAPERPSTAITAAPDLVSAEFVRNTGTGDAQTTTVRYTFDEDVVATVVATAFHLYRYDGTVVEADGGTSADAARDPADARSVLVVFPLTAQEFADVTLATVDTGAVEDADGTANPVGDAPIGDGVTFTAGSTDAPDLVSLTALARDDAADPLLVDFTFDETVFVANPAAGQFQLVFANGSQADGTPVTPGAGDDFGDGTDTVRVSFATTALASTISRGVVQALTVSDAEQTGPALPVLPDEVEGNGNPLQVAEGPANGVTTTPDLVDAEVDLEAGTVTYTFDGTVAADDIAAADAPSFHVYNRAGQQLDGTAAEADGRTVVVTFTGTELADVTGASVDEGAVESEGGVFNREDETGVVAEDGGVAAGATTGPDLVAVERELQEQTTTDPLTGESETTVTGVTVRYVFDDEVATVGAGYVVVAADGTQTPLSSCASVAADEGTAAAEENTVECTAAAEDDPATPLEDESEGFAEASEAVVGTVDAGAATDAEGTDNPEGAEAVEEV
jgi:hypothetical protein